MKENIKKHWITTVIGLLPILGFILVYFGFSDEESKTTIDLITKFLGNLDGGSSITVILSSILALASFVMNIFAKDPKDKKK